METTHGSGLDESERRNVTPHSDEVGNQESRPVGSPEAPCIDIEHGRGAEQLLMLLAPRV